jgi:hypothetical protein
VTVESEEMCNLSSVIGDLNWKRHKPIAEAKIDIVRAHHTLNEILASIDVEEECSGEQVPCHLLNDDSTKSVCHFIGTLENVISSVAPRPCVDENAILHTLESFH